MIGEDRPDTKPVLGLIHSPLVGPFTWSPVAEELRRRGYAAVTPALLDDKTGEQPYWQQHSLSAASGLLNLPSAAALVLVGHSGAGPLLPAIARAAARKISGYIFVDAGLPHPGQSRLEEIEASGLAFARQFRDYLAGGGRFPNWTAEALREILPDETTASRLLAELQPRGLDFFEELMPTLPDWPDAPCRYVQFSPAYDAAGEQARRQGWPYRRLPGGHFHMLVDPAAVAQALIELV